MTGWVVEYKVEENPHWFRSAGDDGVVKPLMVAPDGVKVYSSQGRSTAHEP